MTEFSSKESNEKCFDAAVEKALSKEEEIKNGAVEYTKPAPDKMISQDEVKNHTFNFMKFLNPGSDFEQLEKLYNLFLTQNKL